MIEFSKKFKSLPIEDKIGISTHFMPSTHGEDIFRAIEMVHRAGFAGFEIVPTLDQAQIGFPANYPNVGIDLFESSDADIEKLKRALGVFKWVTVHSPHLDWNLSSANRHLRKLTWNYFERCFDLAVELGAVAVTFHGGGGTGGFIRDYSEIMKYNLEFARYLLPKAKDAGIPAGYEAGGFDYLKYFCDNVTGWGINLDIGHAYMAAGTDDGFFRFIDEFKGKIAEVHHNGVNHYWGGYMEHQPPHMNNMIDFQRVYTRLKEINYEGPIVCEIQGQDIAQVIKHCLESKEMIVNIWNGTLRLKERWNISE